MSIYEIKRPWVITFHKSSGNGFVDASDIGLKAGEWPDTILLRGVRYEKVPAQKRSRKVGIVEYKTSDDLLLEVIND